MKTTQEDKAIKAMARIASSIPDNADAWPDVPIAALAQGVKERLTSKQRFKLGRLRDFLNTMALFQAL